MVYEHNGLSLCLYDLKAIRKEYTEDGGHLIFEFKNAILNAEDIESGKLILNSYQNEPVSQFYDDIGFLNDSYNTWIAVWSELITHGSVKMKK